MSSDIDKSVQRKPVAVDAPQDQAMSSDIHDNSVQLEPVAVDALHGIAMSSDIHKWSAGLELPKVCPAGPQEPVCGSDAYIYPSYCEMRKKSCGKGVTVSSDHGLCQRASGSDCDHKCGKEKDPVCGTDGRTYLNRCMLQVEACRVGISVSHLGACNNISAHRENCPVDCAQAPRDGPVCGSDGNVYRNTCIMKQLTCGQGVVRTSKKHCQTTRHCRESCWRNAKPVCGSDGILYSNPCRMKSKNCGKHVFEVPLAYCLTQERTNGVVEPDCPTSCPRSEAMVCGSDGNVYSSECEMNMMNCGHQTKRRVTKVDLEKCKTRLSKCQKMRCPPSKDAVCGSDAVTYESECHLQVATCLRSAGPHWSMQQDECPSNCDEEDTTPTCGSDGNVYRSLCDLKKETCGQRVVPVALHHCPTTAACNLECSDTRDFVCASDNRFYRNECIMRRENCGKHVFVVPLSRCLAGFQFKGCSRPCPALYDPICASDNKTYSNECFLEMENCRSRSLVTKAHHGVCGQPVPETKNYLY